MNDQPVEKTTALNPSEWAAQYLAQGLNSDWTRLMESFTGPRYENCEPPKIPMIEFYEPDKWAWYDTTSPTVPVTELNYGTAYEISARAKYGEKALRQIEQAAARLGGGSWGLLMDALEDLQSWRYEGFTLERLRMRAISRQRRGYGKRRYRVAQGWAA
jgi:hypothetical protein